MSRALHWLEADGSLAEWRDAAEREIDAALDAISSLLPLPALDILIERRTGGGIPELGLSGRAYRPSLFSVTLDPGNPRFAGNLASGALRQTVVHEVHHCLRMAGPAVRWTLGQALVSEGLAGRFVGHVLGTGPTIWERMSDDVLVRHAPSAAELVAPVYDHPAWFFGVGSDKPRWFGYALGFRIVGDWLARAGTIDERSWIDVSAETVLAASPFGQTR